MVTGGARNAGGRAIDLQRPVAQAMLGQGTAVAPEGVGLDRFCADIQKGLMDLANNIGSGDDKIIDAILISGAAEVVLVEIVSLNAGAHSAIEDDDMIVNGVQVAPVAEGLRGHFHAFSLAHRLGDSTAWRDA